MSLLLIKPFFAVSQQDPFTSQYNFNPIVSNPAFSARQTNYTSDSLLNVTVLRRGQWNSLEGAPKTSVFLAYHNFYLNEPSTRISGGLMFTNDAIGLMNESELVLFSAYNFRVGTNGNLSFGMRMSMHDYNLDLDQLSVDQLEDGALAALLEPGWDFKFGAGVLYYDNGFYAGVSMPYLRLKNKGNSSNRFIDNTTIASSIGYVFVNKEEDVFSQQLFEPKIYSNLFFPLGSTAQLDINVGAFYAQRIFLGTGWKFARNSMNIQMEIQIRQFRISYTADIISGQSRYLGQGVHEVLLNFSILNRSNRSGGEFSLNYF